MAAAAAECTALLVLSGADDGAVAATLLTRLEEKANFFLGDNETLTASTCGVGGDGINNRRMSSRRMRVREGADSDAGRDNVVDQANGGVVHVYCVCVPCMIQVRYAKGKACTCQVNGAHVLPNMNSLQSSLPSNPCQLMGSP